MINRRKVRRDYGGGEIETIVNGFGWYRSRPGLLCFVLKSIASHVQSGSGIRSASLKERFFAKKPEEQPFDVAEGENCRAHVRRHFYYGEK